MAAILYDFQQTGYITPKIEAQRQLGLYSDGTLQVLTSSSIPNFQIVFGDLNLRFLVDENLENYMEIQNWIRGLGYPEEVKQFRDLSDEGLIQGDYINDRQNIYSDGTLQVLSSSLVAKFQVFFKDLFPYSLSTITFDATETDIQYFTADVSFKYTVYDISTLGGTPL